MKNSLKKKYIWIKDASIRSEDNKDRSHCLSTKKRIEITEANNWIPKCQKICNKKEHWWKKIQ